MTPTLRRARVLAALRELDVVVCFDWRGFESFRARPYDHLTDDLPRPLEAAQDGTHGVREAA